jgi:hypothetical protein
MHLANLSQLIRGAGGKGTANELDELCQMLQPFRERKLKDLLATIAKAEEIVRNGQPVAKSRGQRKPKVDVGPITERIVSLYQRASESGVARDEIVTAFAELESAKPTGDELKELASRIGINEKLKKADLLNKMRKVVLDRKDIAERVHA